MNNFKAEIEELKKEQENLMKKSQVLEQQKNEIMTRLVEIQGILKYLGSKEINNKPKE